MVDKRPVAITYRFNYAVENHLYVHYMMGFALSEKKGVYKFCSVFNCYCPLAVVLLHFYQLEIHRYHPRYTQYRKQVVGVIREKVIYEIDILF